MLFCEKSAHCRFCLLSKLMPSSRQTEISPHFPYSESQVHNFLVWSEGHCFSQPLMSSKGNQANVIQKEDRLEKKEWGKEKGRDAIEEILWIWWKDHHDKNPSLHMIPYKGRVPAKEKCITHSQASYRLQNSIQSIKNCDLGVTLYHETLDMLFLFLHMESFCLLWGLRFKKRHDGTFSIYASSQDTECVFLNFCHFSPQLDIALSQISSLMIM